MIKKVIKRLINAIGYELVPYCSPLEMNLNINEPLGYELEEEATECIRIVKNNTMLSKRRLVTLYQQVAYCERFSICGDFVECGVWKGGAMGMMALANLKFGAERRRLHLFDAFQEICEPDARYDGEKACREIAEIVGTGRDSGRLEPLTGIYDRLGGPGTIAENRNLLEETIGYPSEFIRYHVGWFQETLPTEHSEIEAIAILRLDGDLYASTKVCLEHLYDKVVPGGIVIIDDYGAYEGCRRAVDEFMEAREIRGYLNSIDQVGRYFIKASADCRQ